jgi:DNA-binding response OmpR family regulator
LAAPTILVIDDELSLRDVLTQLLILEGYETLDAPTYAQALDILHTQPIDLVLTDFTLSATDGQNQTGLHQLRDAAGAAAVIVLTGSANIGTLKEAEPWLADVLAKPFDIEELLSRVQVALLHLPEGATELPPTFW